jgi:hypothetical protein
MSDKMIIDPQAVAEAAETAQQVSEDLDQAALAASTAVGEAAEPISIREFACRLGLSSATSWWYTRIHDHRLRIDDLAEFMATNAAVAEQYDNEDETSFVELGSEMVGLDEYSQADYYEATGTERPAYDPDARPVVGGEDVPVP